MSAANVNVRSATPCYQQTLREAIDRFLPPRLLPAHWQSTDLRWNKRLTAITALLASWDDSATAQDRFAQARHSVVQMYPTRRRPGLGYKGFVAALAKLSQEDLPTLKAHLRSQVRRQLRGQWMSKRWVLLGADGSRFNAPDTAANEAALKRAGKKKTGPQMLATCLFHLDSGLLWDWRIDAGIASEREQLRQMIGDLPEQVLLVADAGFTGYDLLKHLSERGVAFVIRVGSNVSLLKELGSYARVGKHCVYLWPQGKQHQAEQDLATGQTPRTPPLLLRLIEIKEMHEGKLRTMYLLTNLLSRRVLSDKQARRIYQRRWGCEVQYRAVKETMDRRKMCSRRPTNALLELEWTFLGLWLLGLLSVGRIVAGGKAAGRWSVAGALRVVRWALEHLAEKSPHGGVLGELGGAVKDAYVRKGSKTARHRRDKKREKPPGTPKARKAKKAEVRLAKEVRDALRAA